MNTLIYEYIGIAWVILCTTFMSLGVLTLAGFGLHELQRIIKRGLVNEAQTSNASVSWGLPK